MCGYVCCLLFNVSVFVCVCFVNCVMCICGICKECVCIWEFYKLCFVCACVCVCVFACVDFVMCGCINVCVLLYMAACMLGL